MKINKLSLVKNGIFEIKSQEFEESDNQNLVKVKSLSVGICSSDIPRAFKEKSYFYPLVLGHEFCVSVLEDKKNNLKTGQLCTVFPLIPCFKCESCKSKKYNTCIDYSYYGSRKDGGLQSALYINRWNLIPLPQDIDLNSAALIEPIAVCIHTSKKIMDGKTVLLYGGGFLSQIIAKLLLNKNCKVTIVDRNNYKKKFFDNRVFFTTNEDELKDSNFDIVVECCGANKVFGKCIDFTKNGGSIIQLANPSKEVSLSSDEISKFMRKELNLKGTWNSDYRPDNQSLCDWHEAIKMIQNKYLEVNSLISHEKNIFEAPYILEEIFNKNKASSTLSNYNKAIIKI